MINFNTEYYSNNYYFFLKERADKISLYYSIADTLTESRKNDERIDFDKKDSKKVKNIIFGGRLADYAYYDMDMTISAALTKFNQLKKLIQ